MAGPWELFTDALVEREIRRARLLLGFLDRDLNFLTVALDADSDEFVLVPGVPKGPETRALCMTREGTHILRLAPYQDREPGLCVQNLESGRQRWFPAYAEGYDHLAAFSPDGRGIATLATSADGRALISVIDIETANRRLLWATPGGWIAESAISWSPDGRLIAATYNTEDDEDAFVVIDALDGTVLAQQEDSVTLSSANGTWLTAHELLYLDPDWNLTALNPDTGERQELGRRRSIPFAALEGRILYKLSYDLRPSTSAYLLTEKLDGTDPRAFLDIHPRTSIDRLDIAPLLL